MACRIAVIGAGPGGLVALFTIQRRLLELASPNRYELVAFERGDQVGGEWVLSDKTGYYEDGAPRRSTMYHGLAMNGPGPLADIHTTDYPIEDQPAFSTGRDFLRYLQNFSNKFDLNKFIRFGKMVAMITPDQQFSKSSPGFILEILDVESGSRSYERFDFVFLCVGQFRKPHLPPEMDFSQFKGVVMHNHDVYDPGRLYGKRVLIVGTSYGGMDMMLMLRGHVPALYVCYRSKKPFWYKKALDKWVEFKPLFIKAIGNSVIFEDGSAIEVDVVILATGYRQIHSVSNDMFLDFNKSQILFPLYKHVVHPDYPSLFYIGKVYENIFHLLRLQSEFCCAVIEGSFELPSKKDMWRDVAEFQAKWEPEIEKMADRDVAEFYPVFHLEAEIGSFLAAKAKCPPMPAFVEKILFATLRLIRDDCLNFRRYTLESGCRSETSGNVFIPPSAVNVIE